MKHTALGFLDSATPTMEGIIDLHHYIFFYLILILVFVTWVIIYGCFYYYFLFLLFPKIQKKDAQTNDLGLIDRDHLILDSREFIIGFDSKRGFECFLDGLMKDKWYILLFLFIGILVINTVLRIYNFTYIWGCFIYPLSIPWVYFLIINKDEPYVHELINGSISFIPSLVFLSRLAPILESGVLAEICYGMFPAPFIKDHANRVFGNLNTIDIYNLKYPIKIINPRVNLNNGEQEYNFHIKITSPDEFEYPYFKETNNFPARTIFTPKFLEYAYFKKAIPGFSNPETRNFYESFPNYTKILFSEKLKKENIPSLIKDVEYIKNFNKGQQGSVLTNLNSLTDALNGIIKNKISPLSFTADDFVWKLFLNLPEELRENNRLFILNTARFHFSAEFIRALEGLMIMYPNYFSEIIETIKHSENPQYDVVFSKGGSLYSADLKFVEILDGKNAKSLYNRIKGKVNHENCIIIVNNGNNVGWGPFQETINKCCFKGGFKGRVFVVPSDDSGQFFKNLFNIKSNLRSLVNIHDDKHFYIESKDPFCMATSKELFEKSLKEEKYIHSLNKF